MDYFAKSAAKELEYPGSIAVGDSGNGVRRLQEWLSLSGFGTTVDGKYGDATEAALALFRAKAKLAAANGLDQPTWESLVRPMANLVSPNVATSGPLSQTTLRIAKLHLAAAPLEVGGPNCGPWVRAYMSGNQGRDWPWCAGFVTCIVSQAAGLMGLPAPTPRTFSCDSLAKDAQASGRFIRGKSVDPSSWNGACRIFLVRATANDWTHTGFAFANDGPVFKTIEGNTNDSGGSDGYEVTSRTRSMDGKDFIQLD